MTSEKLPNYLKANRKRLNLRQADISSLLGAPTNETVCRHERFVRIPTLHDAFAYQAIYNKPASELFSGLFQNIQRMVADRAKSLSGGLESPNTRKMGHVFEEISSRLDNTRYES